MTDSSLSIPFNYLRLSDAATALGITAHQLIHGAGTGAVQLCVNLYGRSRRMSIERSDIQDDLPDSDLSEVERTEKDAHDTALAVWLARCTTPMPAGIYEVDAEIARFFEMPETDSVDLYEAYKFDERGWWLVKFYDDETETGEAVEIRRSDFVILREELTRLLKPAPAQSASTEKLLGGRERANLLRIIRALDVMANLPERGAATSVQAQIQALGFNGPGDDTVRDVLKAARALEAD